jgi:hypothetical protein
MKSAAPACGAAETDECEAKMKKMNKPVKRKPNAGLGMDWMAM